MTPTVTGVHHLKFPVRDLAAGLDWFERVLGAEHVARFDHVDEHGHRYAVMVFLPGLGAPVELRHAPEAAVATAGYDPVTFGVADEAALDAWVAHLDGLGVPHSGKVTGYIGQVLGLTTPDGLVLRLYTDPPGGFDGVPMDSENADIHHPALSTSLMRGTGT
ncbi:VOC family protein [Pseudonocardia sp. WMMC193]|uniref:VOC family protein n=1 Tax=Pseudonocardia sp. WMMC193 TaxID=2911965 RepID=UPI001F2C4041|nr:VOC family protein [Pseudonocardia sp. WMMC193]MCF7549328.1 VOC family protein [Pseudonocardia sp. WMMC193]